MSPLILKLSKASRPFGQWRDDDYDVICEGAVVGGLPVARAAKSAMDVEVRRSEDRLLKCWPELQIQACRVECSDSEVLVTAYCGPRRSAVVLVNERTVTCPRGAATSPLVAVCAKAGP
jgi:hypothetical protein